MREWIGDRVPRECIWGIVKDTFDPLRGKVVGHDSTFEALEAWIFDFIESVVVEDRYKRMVIGDDCKVGQACKKQLALSDGP